MTPCPSAQLYAAPRSLSEKKKRPFFFIHPPQALVLSSNLLCQPTPASPAAANEMPTVAHKGRAVAVSALPAKASPHTGLAFPQGSSGQLPLRFTARALGENEAPTNSSPIPGMPPPQNHPWAGSFVFCQDTVKILAATEPFLHCAVLCQALSNLFPFFIQERLFSLSVRKQSKPRRSRVTFKSSHSQG